MAIYHLSAKIFSRREGRSAEAAAAYRAGQRPEETAAGLVFDYTHKPGVDHTEILAPDDSPECVHNRHLLRNAVEEGKKRRDALNRDAQTILLRQLRTTRELIEVSQDYYTTRQILDLHADPAHCSASITMQDIDAAQQAANRWMTTTLSTVLTQTSDSPPKTISIILRVIPRRPRIAVVQL